MHPWRSGRYHYTPVKPLTPDLSKLEFRTGSSLISFTNNPRLTFTKKLWSKARHIATSHLNKYKHRESRLLNLPPEMLLMIALHLPDASRASLAITCKALFLIYSDATISPIASLQLPTEQPSNFHSTRMSKPQNYQPPRWEFLRYLEHDLNGKWQLCSECFILHPCRMFIEFQKSRVPWLRYYYTVKASDYRSCRHERKHLGSERNASFAPVGIVDLCPCIKLTIRKKGHLEAYLRQNAQISSGNDRDQPIAADFWWHQCQHNYHDGAIKLEMKIGIFLYNDTHQRWLDGRFLTVKTNIFSMPPQKGQLGVLIEYRHTYPSTSNVSERSPRLLCPHINLDTAIQKLLHCIKGHDQPNAVCTWCKDIQYCGYCRTKVGNLRVVEATDGEGRRTTTCSYQVERCLDDRLWSIQSVFPYARRQIPLQRRSPLLLA